MSEEEWDIVVVGAGPAGSMAAHQLASAGASVLVVERSHFPRDKVCGCCIGSAALEVLREAGLGGLPTAAGAHEYRELRLASSKRVVSLPVPPGVVLSRAALDHALLRAAVAAGATVRTGTAAELVRTEGAAAVRELVLRSGEARSVVRARVVLACDGLGGGLLRDEPGSTVDVAAGASIGAGAIAPVQLVEDTALGRAVGHGAIHMSCGRAGYVGMVRLEHGELDLAAALRPEALRRLGSPALAVQAILADAGVPPFPALERLRWRGTPALTRRRRRLGAHRILVVGDSAGYVEPFTGDGIAWALAGARAVAPLALAGVRGWSPRLVDEWQARHGALFGRRQRVCRRLGWMLRRPQLTGIVVAALARMPRLSRGVTGVLERPIRVPVSVEGI